MLVFGSETLKDFAFAMVIGLIIGFYSSIAIAVPLYAIWKSREPAYKHLEAKYGTEVGRFEFEHGALRSGRSNVAPELADTSVSARAQSASDSADAGSAAQSSDSGTTMSGTQETRTGATAAAEASAVMTGAQAAKAARAKERKKQAAKMVEDAAQKKTVRTPEVRIVDQEKFDASTAPEPEVPKRGAGRYSDANRAAAELQREELEELRAGDASLEGEMASAAALAEAFEAEETAAERAERMRQIERAEQAARDKAKAAARREKRKRNANK